MMLLLLLSFRFVTTAMKKKLLRWYCINFEQTWSLSFVVHRNLWQNTDFEGAGGDDVFRTIGVFFEHWSYLPINGEMLVFGVV